MLLLLVVSSLAATAGNPKKDPKAPIQKISRPGFYQGYSEAVYKGFNYNSLYLPMRDSVLLAADVFLPKGLKEGDKVPTILYLTRYVRSVQAKFPFSIFKDPILTQVSEKEIDFFTSYGYACVIVDVRGSGASLGERRMEFSPEEVADGKEIVDWIIAQPWSSGNVGSTGVSYLGTTAEMLLTNQHPAVKACIPRSNIFDLYADILFPGGVCLGPFVDKWGYTTKSLDNNNYKPFTNKAGLLNGVHPVKGDKNKAHLKRALALHKENFDVFEGLKLITFRDDAPTKLGLSANDFSIHARRDLIEASGTPIYRIGGWYDGALAKSCTDGYMNTSNTKKVLIGPWDHGPQNNASPFADSKKVTFNVYAEMLRFFDYYLKGIDNGIDDEPVFTYYTVGEELWKTSNSWPIKGAETQKLFFTTDNTLQANAGNVASGDVNYKVDYTATTGKTTRWNSITTLFMNGPTSYSNRSEEDKKLLTFTSSPIEAPMEITGHPVVNISFSADATDATVFCYLEDVAPDGSVTYVTEGQFRPMHAAIATNAEYKTAYPAHSYKKSDQVKTGKNEKQQLYFDLLPISYQFKKGHSVRVSIAGADIGHFDLPEHKPENFVITCDAGSGSFIELPVVEK